MERRRIARPEAEERNNAPNKHNPLVVVYHEGRGIEHLDDLGLIIVACHDVTLDAQRREHPLGILGPSGHLVNGRIAEKLFAMLLIPCDPLEFIWLHKGDVSPGIAQTALHFSKRGLGLN